MRLKSDYSRHVCSIIDSQMPQKKIRIAVVDDNSSFRTALQRLLSASGLDVETFASGQEFLDSLENSSPRLSAARPANA